jgi:hypothetical protein
MAKARKEGSNIMGHTAKEMIPAVGQVVQIRAEGWVIPMTVKDVMGAWGKIRLLVTPLRGDGEQWVELGRVTRQGCGLRAVVVPGAVDMERFERAVDGLY